jgi:WD40 repeat protein
LSLLQGRLLATEAEDVTVRLWETATGKPVQSGGGHRAGITSVQFVRGGRLATWSFWEDGVHLWGPRRGQEVRRSEWTDHERLLALSPDGDTAIVSRIDRPTTVLALGSGKPLLRLKGSSGLSLEMAAFSSDGQALMTLWTDVYNWWPTKGLSAFRRAGKWVAEPVKGVVIQHPEKPRRGTRFDGRMGFSPDGRMLAATAHDDSGRANVVWLWRVRGDRLEPHRPVEAVRGHSFAFSRGGLLVTAVGGAHVAPRYGPAWGHVRDHLRGARGDVVVRDLATGKSVRRIPDHQGEYSAVALSANGRFLALGTAHGPIRLWDLLEDREVARLDGHQGGVWALCFSGDGRLASGSNDATALVWDLERILPLARRPVPLKEAEVRSLWAELASDDPWKASRAGWRLALASEQAFPLLKKNLHPVSANLSLPRLVRELGSTSYVARDKATRDLVALGFDAESALRAVVRSGGDLEVRRRAERLLKGLEADILPARELRAVMILEQIGSAQARRLLAELAGGAPKARLTKEAAAALRRLSNTRTR